MKTILKVVVVVAVVVAAFVVCDLEISGRNNSNCVNKKEKIDIILYLLLVGGTHSECPRAHAIGRSCGSSAENYVRPCRGSILRGRCRCILFRRCVLGQPFQCRRAPVNNPCWLGTRASLGGAHCPWSTPQKCRCAGGGGWWCCCLFFLGRCNAPAQPFPPQCVQS